MRVVNALIYAVITGLGVIVASGKAPSDYVEWCGLALAVISSGYGKYTNNDNLLSPNRRIWTEEERQEKQGETEDQRRLKLGLPPKRPII